MSEILNQKPPNPRSGKSPTPTSPKERGIALSIPELAEVWLILFLPLWGLGGFTSLYAQEDSLKQKNLGEVVITATRTEKMLSALPMPVAVVSQAQIRAIGSMRLTEVLQEQTGLAIVNDHGQGIQMQGFSPDYTLILLDGEPLIGRTAGTLELSRLAVGNIKQIEIVKGASSSLYGSEALAGVVNIITENPQNTNLSLSSRYGSNQTLDISGNVNFKKDKFGFSLFGNRYSTQGYDFSPETAGQTVEPFHNYTFQSKLRYTFSPKINLSISGRYFAENQQSSFDVGTIQNPELVSGEGQVKDYNLNPILEWKANQSWKTQFRWYASRYETESELRYESDGAIYDATFFRQTFQRPEIQSTYFLNQRNIFTGGVGHIRESVEATRYEGTKRFSSTYAFLQYEFLPTQKWNLIFGGRLDAHSVYGNQFSPKFSVQYDISPKIAVRGSFGAGFKAPDFRQLYLNFTNAVAGYSVFGSEELVSALARLEADNQIADILLPLSEIGNLKAESSLTYNIGFKIKPTQSLTWKLNAFRNDVQNLIETQAVARKTNGQNVFSYRNLNEIFTQGIETDWYWKLNKSLSLSAGYQYLIAKDKAVLEEIKRGEIFRRDTETGTVSRVQQSEYGGLMGRSRNMWNVKVFYEETKTGISANLRGIYRGRYGLGDTDGNLILDNDAEYVQGYLTWNLAFVKDFWKKQIRLQIGADNVLNYQDKSNIPNLAGRLWWVRLEFNLQKPLQ
jgi:outer membrane receptor for ferrienterochelin and colicins